MGDNESRAGGARILAVDAGSPAEAAGLEPGMIVLKAGSQPLRDIIDWLWLSDGSTVDIEVSNPGGNPGGSPGSNPGSNSGGNPDSLDSRPVAVTLRRQPGQGWGIEFADPLFDGVMTCANDCSFCFIDQLPTGLRPSLYLRDDDYRLSFLQGSFVTLSNLGPADLSRIIDMRLMPLHVSLHVLDGAIRHQLMGQNADTGLSALSQLLAAGITAHVQIVLVPGLNDGDALVQTLDWATSQPGILSVGIVPYAYTKYASVTNTLGQAEAAQLIDGLLQLSPRVQLADEWFLAASRPLPPASYYGDYPQYQNGIGLIRAFVDDWAELAAASYEEAEQLGLPARQAGPPAKQPELPDKPAGPPAGLPPASPAVLVTGTAFAPILAGLIEGTPQAQGLQVLAVENRFFGGSVNAAGLLTAADIVLGFTGQDPGLSAELPVLLPSVMFNSDGLTLDGETAAGLAAMLGRPVHVVTYIQELLQ